MTPGAFVQRVVVIIGFALVALLFNRLGPIFFWPQMVSWFAVVMMMFMTCIDLFIPDSKVE